MYFLISVKNNFTVERGRTIQICFRALNIFYFLRRRWQHRSVCVCVQTRDITIRSSSSAPQSAALNRQSRCRPRWWCSRQRRMWGVCQEQRGALGVRCCHIAETRGRDLWPGKEQKVCQLGHQSETQRKCVRDHVLFILKYNNIIYVSIDKEINALNNADVKTNRRENDWGSLRNHHHLVCVTQNQTLWSGWPESL